MARKGKLGIGSKFILMFVGVGIFIFGGQYLVQEYDPIVAEAPAIPNNLIPMGKDLTISTAPITEYVSPVTASGPMSYRWATIPWNGMSGAMFAVSGENSLMKQYGLDVTISRQDSYSQMQNDLVTFAEAYSKGDTHTSKGVQFVTIMGNGAPAFVAELNEQLRTKLGPNYIAQIVAGVGFSRGEDQCMASPEALKNKLRGSLIAAVKADGDEDICFAYMGSNGVANNPDSTTYDPDKVNWVHVDSFVEADNKWLSNYCETRPVISNGVKTGSSKKVCVDGVGTWFPGDDVVARGERPIVTVASTKDDYMWLMPTTVITIKQFAEDNRADVENMLAAVLEGGTRVNASDADLLVSATTSAAIYKEENGAYWAKAYKGYTVKGVEVGGSYANNLGDAINTFGLRAGQVDVMTAVLNGRGQVAQSQYPDLIKVLPDANEVINKSFIQALMKRVDDANINVKPFTPTFSSTDTTSTVVGKKVWKLAFRTGSANFTEASKPTLAKIVEEQALTGLKLQIHGYTDSTGSAAGNAILSGKRANAVKTWVTSNYSKTFPDARIDTVAHGQDDPIATNATPTGRALNRRVEIWLVK